MIVLFSSFHSRSLVHSNLLTVILPCSIPFDISAVAWPTSESTIFRSSFNYFVRLYRHGSSLSFDFYPITVLFAPLSGHSLLLLLLLMLPFFFFFLVFSSFVRRILVFPVFRSSINRLESALEVRASSYFGWSMVLEFCFILFICFQLCDLDLASSDCLLEPPFFFFSFIYSL